MNHRPVVVLATIALLASSGCGVINNSDDDQATAAPTPAATTEATPAATGAAAGGAGDGGNIPDPCTLLTKADVTSLTGRNVTRIDKDGASDGDVSRFCQWQQSSGQLAIFLTRTTADEFKVTVAEAKHVDGLGDDAYTANGHLYVLDGTVQIDVYARGGSDAENLTTAEKVANVLIPKI